MNFSNLRKSSQDVSENDKAPLNILYIAVGFSSLCESSQGVSWTHESQLNTLYVTLGFPKLCQCSQDINGTYESQLNILYTTMSPHSLCLKQQSSGPIYTTNMGPESPTAQPDCTPPLRTCSKELQLILITAIPSIFFDSSLFTSCGRCQTQKILWG